MKPKHEYAEYIKLWLDGADVQYKNNRAWVLVTNLYDFDRIITEFRVKSEVNPTKVMYVGLILKGDEVIDFGYSDWRDQCDTLQITFSIETGEVIAAEVLE